MISVIKRCNGMVPDGETCQLCGKIHRPVWKSPYLWLAIIAAGIILWYIYKQRETLSILRSWDVLPANDSHLANAGYWRFRGESGISHGPSDDPITMLRQLFVTPPSFRDMR